MGRKGNANHGKELHMFEVSQEASDRIKQFLEGSEGPRSIRILTTEGGWRGTYLVMALDEQKKGDEIFVDNGVTFIMEKELFERVKPIRIGYTHSTLGLGYTIDSALKRETEGVNVCHEICSSCDEIE
jgi:iron-sulfur cluster assembly protein